jgi:hypothetical protein
MEGREEWTDDGTFSHLPLPVEGILNDLFNDVI